MKSVVFVISLLLAFSSSCASQLLQVVRDTDGEILRRNTRYFVVPVIRGFGGGVTRGPTINGAAHDANFVCPFQVVQSQREVSKGMSVYFKPKAHKQVEITESSDVNIEFYLDNPSGICNNSVWEAEGFPGDEIPMFLSTNGKAGNPLEVATWFQIKKVDDFSYKLVFCPYGEHICTDIGTKMVDGQRRLGIRTGNTFYVAFIKDPVIGIKSII